MARDLVGSFFHSPTNAYQFIKRIERREHVMRIDNRTPERLVIDHGLPARISHELMRKLYRKCVDNHQNYNINPFGYGTYLTYQKLEKEYIRPNASHFEKAHVYSFIGKGFSIPEYCGEIGESGDQDYEGEFLITYKVILADFLTAVGAEHRDKFNKGLLVPNDGVILNPELPNKVRLSDLKTPSTTLAWLLQHNAQKTAKRYAKLMFEGKSEQFLEKFVIQKELIDFISKIGGLKLTNFDAVESYSRKL